LRIKAEGWHRELWNWLFWAGSFLAAFAQGLMIGRYITGFDAGLGYWLFALVTGAALCGGYVLLGATWLIYRVEGELREKAVLWARWGLLWVALGVALVSLGTPLVSETVREKWFSFPRIVFLSVLPIGTIVAWFWVWFSVRKSDKQPFLGAISIFVLAFAGLAYSLFPYVIIDRMTIWQAAAHESALKFVLAGAVVVLPFIFGYTFFVYRLFGGKTKDGGAY
jgi:cytochrome d ubiquinol oxidase subunit II